LGFGYHLYSCQRILVFNNVLDLYDRKIIGLSSGMSVEETSLAAWRMAIKTEASQRDYISF
jgi:hypothetical protein